MNFVQWLFGTSTPKPSPAASVPPQEGPSNAEKNETKKIKIEAELNKLDAKIK